MRKNQKVPVTTSPTLQNPASRGRRARTAYQTTPMVNAISGTATVNFVESASPAATPASAVDTTSPSPSMRSATLASSNARQAISVEACPGWVPVSDGSPTTTNNPSNAKGAAPRELPMHQAASAASAPQPTLRSGDSTSRPNATTAIPCNNSAL